MKPTLDLNLEIPPEIQEAAVLITNWTITHGWKEWELLGVADRNLVTKLRATSRLALAEIERLGGSDNDGILGKNQVVQRLRDVLE